MVSCWVKAQTTTTYNLGDQSTFTNTGVQWDPVTSTTSPDGKLRTQAATSKWHSTGYGISFQEGNSLELDVDGGSTVVRFYGSVYSAGTMDGGTSGGASDLGSMDVDMDAYPGMGDQTGYYEFSHFGGATTLYFTFSGSNAYTPAIAVTLTPVTIPDTDVWDFGATQLTAGNYNNVLNETVINTWYDGSVTPGTSGVVLPSAWTAGALSWVGASNDRLRTVNTNLTRYDANVASVTGYDGRVYCNGIPSTTGGLPASRYMVMVLGEDDEVTIIGRSDTEGSLSFVYEADPAAQTDNAPTTSVSGALSESNFVAKQAGTYRIFDQTAKASFYRIYRTPATYVNVTGSVDVTNAPGIPGDYAVVFTNAAGKSWTAAINSGSYSVTVPVGYEYELSLVNANGYIITTGATLNTDGILTPGYTHDLVILAVNLYTVTGTITGLDANIDNLTMSFVANPAAGTIYVPVPVIDAANGTYSVQLESGIEYTIVAEGVNDFDVAPATLTIPDSNTTAEIAFTPKPTYPVTINTTGLTTEQEGALALTFTNLNETGYSYTFTDMSAIALRDGTYTVSYSGMDMYPVQLALTSNLVIDGAAASKTLDFVPVTVWPFNDQVINTSTTAYYKGMVLNGQITTVVSSGHLTAKTGATIQVPVNPGEKVVVSYYYTANFTIEGSDPYITTSNTTSIIESAQYAYTGGAAGYVTITVGGDASTTSYFTEIKVLPNVAFQPTITVGVDKEYQTINAALTAISQMERPNNERVTIMVDSGNYEEMLVIDQPNITLANASANPNIALVNQGVDITDGAVRVTSYYGHGYTYYSMGNDQKWHQDVLNTNISNGYASYQNVGAGTTNGSYWNATVVVRANGFEAEHIIFENSFNQYISAKEAQDVVVAWSTGSPGPRPTDLGNVSVQNRTMVERAAAIAIANNTDKVILNQCRVVGRQDSFYGGVGSRVAVYKGDMMGAVDYIFGGMDAVFYQTDLSMNVSDQSNDQAYITAAQQSSGRGFLMYECTVTSTEPGVETASVYRAKPGYYGRPWLATTSEVVFYNTTIETSDYPGFEGNSLIMPLGWQNTLGGTSAGMYEYGTIEESGVDNTPNRASWSTTLTSPVLTDGTDITPFNFTKGNDNWDPFAALIKNDPDGYYPAGTGVNVFAYGDTIAVKNVQSNTKLDVYAITGALVKTVETDTDTSFTMGNGFWIVVVKAADGQKSVKLVTY